MELNCPPPPWVDPPAAHQDSSTPVLDPVAYGVGLVLANLIDLGLSTAPRSTQAAIGASQIGNPCRRAIAYKLNEMPKVNHRDPLRTMVGTGMHSVLADLFTRIDAGSGRFLVEMRVNYRGIPGSIDLYDRAQHLVVDWKSATLKKIRDLKRNGPAPTSRVQIQTYAAALAAAGETPHTVALVYIPIDGTLGDVYVWCAPVDASIVDAAIEVIETVAGELPANVFPNPSRLCPWCDYYQPGSTDLNVSCPGEERKINEPAVA